MNEMRRGHAHHENREKRRTKLCYIEERADNARILLKSNEYTHTHKTDTETESGVDRFLLMLLLLSSISGIPKYFTGYVQQCTILTCAQPM